jgi:pyruvate-ferredoxin/flavodoxin oxidoreductase
MSDARRIIVDGNEAAASVAHRLSEVIAIYPITPSSNMGELADAWSAHGEKNVWGLVPDVVEMQSEGGAAGAVHGALQAGALATTFTASQGLLLMIPNMYKIAGELTPFAMHVAARSLATHALSIFGDHSDVMACRATGFAMLAAGSVQEAHDFALVAHAATLRSRVPFLHFFDGFRTSHELARIEELTDDDLRALVSDDDIRAHRARALTPDHPVVRGTAQNPDAFFQAREAGNRYWLECPAVVQQAFDALARRTGRQYHLFDYVGHPEAERVIVMMGSGAETVHETVEHLVAKGERVGVLKVRLYRPFPCADFLAALPLTVKRIAVLDRTKEPGAPADPLHLDVLAAFRDAVDEGTWTGSLPRVVGGRYGLSSKEFDPAMVMAVYANLGADKPRNHFTIGIVDDVTHTSLPWDRALDIEPGDVKRAVFYGLGADGTVGANKNSIKIIGDHGGGYAQGYFVYDSKKSGATTVSHLRFGPRPLRSSYLVKNAQFVACHQFEFVDRLDVLELAAEGATFLLNAPYAASEVWGRLPREVQQVIVDRRLALHVIDADKVAREAGMGSRINTIMQVCFFKLSGVLPVDEAITEIKEAIEKTYGKRGGEVVRRNFAAVDAALAHLERVAVPAQPSATRGRPPLVAKEAPDFVQRVTSVLMAGKGDLLPVSAFPVDGTWPMGTTRWEKRNIALDIPVWDEVLCIQCNQCVLACPHAAIRAKRYAPEALAGAPETFKAVDFKSNDYKGQKYTIQVAPEDCTGCTLCVEVCPAREKTNPRRKALGMVPQRPLREQEAANYGFFLELPETDRTAIKRFDVKETQFLQPLFEYSGACSGCGETPYVKLLTQLFGDRALIANATGCSSIYGANLPTTPYCTNAAGRGPAWANSLFEDNAEFGLGYRLAVDTHERQAKELLQSLSGTLPGNLVTGLLDAGDQHGETALQAQRDRVAELRRLLRGNDEPRARRLDTLAEYLVRKSIWLVGGDGWAYDIGFGGLDHVMAGHRDVNILVLDTEVYSNTGGQQSKATPRGAVAKFAEAGKEGPKKDLGLLAMSYGHVYVARVAFGAKMAQTVQAFQEADTHRGPSLILAYSHCIAHGYDMAMGAEQQRRATESGIWPLYRFDPRHVAEGKPPLHMDSGAPKGDVLEYMRNESRFRMVEKQDPARFKRFVAAAREDAHRRVAVYQQLAALTVPRGNGEAKATETAVVEAAATAAAAKDAPAVATKN